MSDFLLLLHINIVFLDQVGDDLRRKELGFGRNVLRTKVVRVRVEPAAEGVPRDTRRSG